MTLKNCICLPFVMQVKENAYCCVGYGHIVTEYSQKFTLRTSKIRVAPLKSITLNRLELTVANDISSDERNRC